jgi:hypothetical protein
MSTMLFMPLLHSLILPFTHPFGNTEASCSARVGRVLTGT